MVNDGRMTNVLVALRMCLDMEVDCYTKFMPPPAGNNAATNNTREQFVETLFLILENCMIFSHNDSQFHSANFKYTCT